MYLSYILELKRIVMLPLVDVTCYLCYLPNSTVLTTVYLKDIVPEQQYVCCSALDTMLESVLTTAM